MSHLTTALLALLAPFALLGGCGRIGFTDQVVSTAPDAPPAWPVVPPPPIYTNGARLHAEYFEIGAQRQFATWFDTQLGEPCAVATAEDGVPRCLPTALSTGYQFSDATCTTPLVIALTPTDKTDCPSTDAHAGLALDGRIRIVELGAVYGGTVYQKNGDGTCQIPGNSGFPYLVVGATVPPSTFVAVHEELTRSGDLAYIEQVSDDGARRLLTDHVVVATTGERAQLVAVSHDEVEVVPDEPIGAQVYGEATCTEPAVLLQSAPAGGHALVDELHDTCSDALSDATLGAELPAYYVHDGSGGCVAQAPPELVHVYSATLAPLAPVSTGVLAVPAGDPVVVGSWQLAQGQTLPAGLYDVAHGDACAVISLSGSHARVCAPIWNGYPTLYSDATCATAITGYPRCRGGWRATWYPDAFLSQTCEGNAWHVYADDQPIPGPYYAQIGEACSLADAALVAPFGQSASELPAAAMTPVARKLD